MSLRSRVTLFRTGTGIATSTVTVAHGLGVAPKVLLFFLGGTAGANPMPFAALGAWRPGFGFVNCIPGTPVNVGVGSQAATGQPAGTRGARSAISTTSCVILPAPTATTINGAGHVSAVNATDFTFTIDIAFGNSLDVHVLALGGEDITNVFVGTTTVPGSTGTADVTGLGFNPAGGGRSLLLIGHQSATAADTATVPCRVAIGAALSSSERCVTAVGVRNAVSPTVCDRYNYDGECVAGCTLTTPGAVLDRADFSAWITDGFRLNWLEVGTTAILPFCVIEGPRFAIKKATTSASANGQVGVTGAGFSPQAGIILGTSDVLSTQDAAATDGAIWSVGYFDAVYGQMSGAATDPSGVTTTAPAEGRGNEVYEGLTSAGAVENTMALQTRDADGATYVMTSAAPVGSDNFFSVLMGPASTAPQAANTIPSFHTWSWQ